MMFSFKVGVHFLLLRFIHKITTQHNSLELKYINVDQPKIFKYGSLNWSLGNKSLE